LISITGSQFKSHTRFLQKIIKAVSYEDTAHTSFL
jgi:hypothetical protein